MAITMKIIARDLGLAESTISRAINNKGRINPETRQRILDYVRQLDYHPDETARGLKLQSNRIIGVLVPDSTNVYYSHLLKSVEAYATDRQYSVILCNSDEQVAKEDQYIDFLLANRVCGMIAASTGSSRWGEIDRQFLDKVVFVDNVPAVEVPVDSVTTDNYQAAFELTEKLIRCGHTRIATLTGPVIESTAAERYRGFSDALARHGLEIQPDWVIHTNFLFEDSRAKADALFADSPPVTAVLAQNNVIAYAFWRAASDHGAVVPRDVSIACFDHIDPYGFMYPDFTAMQQPVARIGQLAAQVLMTKMENPKTVRKPQAVILPSAFHPGMTCCANAGHPDKVHQQA